MLVNYNARTGDKIHLNGKNYIVKDSYPTGVVLVNLNDGSVDVFYYRTLINEKAEFLYEQKNQRVRKRSC